MLTTVSQIEIQLLVVDVHLIDVTIGELSRCSPCSLPAKGPAGRFPVPAAPRLQRRGSLLALPGRVQRLLGQGAAADEVRTPCV